MPQRLTRAARNSEADKGTFTSTFAVSRTRLRAAGIMDAMRSALFRSCNGKQSSSCVSEQASHAATGPQSRPRCYCSPFTPAPLTQPCPRLLQRGGRGEGRGRPFPSPSLPRACASASARVRLRRVCSGAPCPALPCPALASPPEGRACACACVCTHGGPGRLHGAARPGGGSPPHPRPPSGPPSAQHAGATGRQAGRPEASAGGWPAAAVRGSRLFSAEGGRGGGPGAHARCWGRGVRGAAAPALTRAAAAPLSPLHCGGRHAGGGGMREKPGAGRAAEEGRESRPPFRRPRPRPRRQASPSEAPAPWGAPPSRLTL